MSYDFILIDKAAGAKKLKEDSTNQKLGFIAYPFWFALYLFLHVRDILHLRGRNLRI